MVLLEVGLGEGGGEYSSLYRFFVLLFPCFLCFNGGKGRQVLLFWVWVWFAVCFTSYLPYFFFSLSRHPVSLTASLNHGPDCGCMEKGKFVRASADAGVRC